VKHLDSKVGGICIKFKSSKSQLIFGITSFTFILMLSAITIVGTPYTFVRILTLLSVITCAGGIGAFVRELFVIKEQRKAKNMDTLTNIKEDINDTP
jgi:hypothetical protein